MSGERIASTVPKRNGEELNHGTLSEAAMRVISARVGKRGGKWLFNVHGLAATLPPAEIGRGTDTSVHAAPKEFRRPADRGLESGKRSGHAIFVVAPG